MERAPCMKAHQSLVNGMMWERKMTKNAVPVYRKLSISPQSAHPPVPLRPFRYFNTLRRLKYLRIRK